MSQVPQELKYTKSDEWVLVEGDIATIGITDYAQDQLGDIVYLSLPEAGRMLQTEEQFGEVESVKAVSELLSPLSGEVIESNTGIADTTETVNSDPYGNGWLIKVRLKDSGELSSLLSADDYTAYCEERGH